MIGKIIALVVMSIISALALSNIFSFSGTTTTTLPEQNLSQTNQTVPINVLDPAQWTDIFSKFMGNVVNIFSSYVTEYFKKIFPNMSATFAPLFFLFAVLFFLWLLSSKFEHIFKSIILVAMLLVLVFLIMSVIGFV